MRPTKDQYFMAMAKLVSERSTCASRKVGCVLVDIDGHVLSTGYNGVPPGVHHCGETCPLGRTVSGQGLDKCEAIHAEQNALLQCPDVSKIYRAYVTCSPCFHCLKLFMNTKCLEIYYADEYADKEAVRVSAVKWEKSMPKQRRMIRIDETEIHIKWGKYIYEPNA